MPARRRAPTSNFDMLTPPKLLLPAARGQALSSCLLSAVVAMRVIITTLAPDLNLVQSLLRRSVRCVRCVRASETRTCTSQQTRVALVRRRRLLLLPLDRMLGRFVPVHAGTRTRVVLPLFICFASRTYLCWAKENEVFMKGAAQRGGERERRRGRRAAQSQAVHSF